jgi:uncharacterized phage infection (PIP) family protein YhgE
MSEDRLATIESLLGKVVSRGEELAGGQQGLLTQWEGLADGQRTIVTRLDEFAGGQHTLITRVDELATGQQGLATRVDELAAGQQGLVTRVDELAVGQRELQVGQKRLDARIEEVDRHMHVLHENVLDRIAAIPTDGPSKVEVKRWIDDQGEAIGRRLDPVEAAVTRHSAEIERLISARE